MENRRASPSAGLLRYQNTCLSRQQVKAFAQSGISSSATIADRGSDCHGGLDATALEQSLIPGHPSADWYTETIFFANEEVDCAEDLSGCSGPNNRCQTMCLCEICPHFRGALRVLVSQDRNAAVERA